MSNASEATTHEVLGSMVLVEGEEYPVAENNFDPDKDLSSPSSNSPVKIEQMGQMARIDEMDEMHDMDGMDGDIFCKEISLSMDTRSGFLEEAFGDSLSHDLSSGDSCGNTSPLAVHNGEGRDNSLNCQTSGCSSGIGSRRNSGTKSPHLFTADWDEDEEAATCIGRHYSLTSVPSAAFTAPQGMQSSSSLVNLSIGKSATRTPDDNALSLSPNSCSGGGTLNLQRASMLTISEPNLVLVGANTDAALGLPCYPGRTGNNGKVNSNGPASGAPQLRSVTNFLRNMLPLNRLRKKRGSAANDNVKAKEPTFTTQQVLKWQMSLAECLADPAGLAVFSEFVKSEHSLENILFWKAVGQYRDNPSKAVAQEICFEYILESAPHQVNIEYRIKKSLLDQLKSDPDVQGALFDKALKHIMDLVKRDSYRRFLASPSFKEVKKSVGLLV